MRLGKQEEKLNGEVPTWKTEILGDLKAGRWAQEEVIQKSCLWSSNYRCKCRYILLWILLDFPQVLYAWASLTPTIATDESFYLDNPIGARWLTFLDNLIFFKKKGRKMGDSADINANSKTSLYLYEMNFNTENYLRVLDEAVEEIKNSETQYIQMDNAKYHWTTEVLEFYYREKDIKVIDWSPYPPDLNPIENIWVIMKQKLEGRNFTTMISLKTKYTTFGEFVLKKHVLVYMIE